MTTDHDEIRELLHAHVDGELDPANARMVEQHLKTCDECLRLEDQIRALNAAITNSAPAYQAPAQLRRNVRAALRREAKSDRKTSSPWLVLTTAAAFALLVVSLVLFGTTRASHTNAVADQIIGNHVRSLLATHLVDVPSSDQHTVKPWFEGKIDFAPPVNDFAAQGYPLVGGRLDYLDGKNVAAVVYRRNKHPINVFIAPTTMTNNTSPTLTTRRGYNLFHWTRNGMDYWAISDLNETELKDFASLLNQ